MTHDQVIEKNIEYLPVIYLTKSMTDLYQKGKSLSGKNSSVLITGENGTGKELLAKSIHYNLSPNAPFVTINCVNLPFTHFEEKIESCFTIFTGNDFALPEESAGMRSTLFLRDVEKLEGDVQGNLFNLLSEKISGSASAKSENANNVRLIFSFSQGKDRDSLPEVFDKSTYETFDPFLLSILPLRERREDIQPLALFFVDKFSKEYGQDIGGIHSEALQVLESYEWPENVSELRDVIENAVLLSQRPLITREDIRFNISKKSIALESFLSREDFFTLEELERIYIQTVLRRVKNNKSRASKILDISRNTLQRRIDSFAAVSRKNSRSRKKGQQPLLF